jgi:hypothetical protein
MRTAVRGPAGIAAALLCGAVLFGCASTSDEAQLTSVLHAAFGSHDRAVCSLMVTPHVLAQRWHANGPFPRQACVNNLDGVEPALAVKVSHVAVSDRQAEATASIRGGVLDGQAFDVALIKLADQWKVDKIRSVQVDFPRFVADLCTPARGHPSPGRLRGEQGSRDQDCRVAMHHWGRASSRGASDAEQQLETRSSVGGVRAESPYTLLARHVPSDGIDCMIRRMRKKLSDDQLMVTTRNARAGTALPTRFLHLAVAIRDACAAALRHSGG